MLMLLKKFSKQVICMLQATYLGKRTVSQLKYLLEYTRIQATELFDNEYYLNTYKDVKLLGVNPLLHYIKNGWKEGRNPSRLFNTKYYLRTNPDVAQANINPLYHYVKTGIKEGRRSCVFINELIQRNSNDSILNTDWIRRLIKTYKDGSFSIFYYCVDFVVNQLNSNQNIYQQIKNCWIDFFNQADDETRFIMSKLFYLCRIFDDDISLLIMNYAAETNNPTYRYWTTQDISSFAFALQKGFYDGFYQDRRMLLRKVARENFEGKEFFIKQRCKQVKKLCIISYLLDPDMHNSMERVAVMFANGLSEYFEITVITLDCKAVSKYENKEINTLFKTKHFREIKDKASSYFKKEIDIKAVTGRNYKEKLNNTLKMIDKYKPDAILDISDEFSPMSYYYSKKYPTLYVPMRSGGSSSFFDIILCDDDPEYKDFKCVYWMFPEYVPKKHGHFSRKEIGITDCQFVILTIGNNGCQCPDNFVEPICQLLLNESDIVWIFVGGNAPDIMHILHQNLFEEGKIIEWGFENNLAAFCTCGDVVVRPNVCGCSGATAIAAQQGLPIILTDFSCDPMRWLGADYPYVKSYENMPSEILKLKNNKQYYKERQNQTIQKVNEVIETPNTWWKLAETIKEYVIEL